MTSMLLSRLHYPIRNLGYGVRAGIWFQGCTVYCHGCVSRDTWPFDESRRIDVSAVTAWIGDIDGALDGVTISGGEPTDQPEALRSLLAALASLHKPTDIVLYSGRTIEHIDRELPWLRDYIDVLISDPFETTSSADCAMRGSTNQRVHRFSTLAEERYPSSTFEDTYGPQRRQISVHVADDAVWLVGIPQRGDLPRMRDALDERGISVGRTSWLT